MASCRTYGLRHWKRQLFQIMLYAVLILGVFGLLSQIILLSSKFRIISLLTNADDNDNLELSNATERTINNQPKTFLSYKHNFSFPLDIDIAYLVNEKIQFNISIPHEAINPHPFRYMNLPHSCDFRFRKSFWTENDTILVLVKSSASHYALRAAIRSIWKTVDDPGIKKVFLLGYDGINQSQINEESQNHGDIVQEDFKDAYRNNTFKTIMAEMPTFSVGISVMGYNWAIQFCSKVKFLFFMDDDYYLKLSDLASYLRKIPEENRHSIYIGSLSKAGVPYRDKNTRWYVSAEEYPFDLYPPYIGGGAYVVSYDVALRFHLAFPFIKYIPIDDAYLGIVARKLMIKPRRDIKFQSYYRGAIAKECSHDASELVKQVCPLARLGYNIYIHQNKKRPKNRTLLRSLLITIGILVAALTFIALPVFLHLYCEGICTGN